MTERYDHVPHVEEADPDALATLTVGIVGALVLAIVVVMVQGFYQKALHDELVRKVVSRTPEETRALRASQLERLSRVKWVDREHGLVTLPIDEAIARMLRDPNPAAPVVLPPQPVSAAQAAPAATPSRDPRRK